MAMPFFVAAFGTVDPLAGHLLWRWTSRLRSRTATSGFDAPGSLGSWRI